MIEAPRPEVRSADAVVGTLFTLLRTRGLTSYDAAVTQLEHALQSAMLAQVRDVGPDVVVAALLHDVGHLLLDEHHERPDFLATDRGHELVGARFLARWLPPSVTEPIALHVRAKRFLVTTDPAYARTLSPSSQRSLAVQGGPFDARELAEFCASAFADAAVLVRRCDDRAKVAGRSVPPLEAFADIIGALVR